MSRAEKPSLRHHKRLAATAAAVLVLLALVFVAGKVRKTPARAVIRAEELARLRFVAGRLTQYANEYHRPAFQFDSVAVHLDSAHAAEFRSYLTDLWGDSIGYYWNFTAFKLWSDAGVSNMYRVAAVDSAMRQARIAVTPALFTDPELRRRLGTLEAEVDERLSIEEWYGWPEAAQRDSMRLRKREREE